MVILTLNARSGKRVEVLDPTSTLLDPTVGSEDVDEIMPFRIGQVMAALKPAMEGMQCTVGKETSDLIECSRGLRNSGRAGWGGEQVTAVLEALGQKTRVRINTGKRLLARNWSTPIYRELKRRLESSGT
jgi:hypothetical protein